MVAGRASVAGQTVEQKAHRDPVCAFVERPDRDLDERGGPGRQAGRKGRLGRTDLELDEVGSAAGSSIDPGLGPGASAPRLVGGGGELERDLELGKCLVGRVERFGLSRRLERRDAGRRRPQRGPPVARCRSRTAGQADGEGGVMTWPLEREDVGGHGPADQLVPEVEGFAAGVRAARDDRAGQEAVLDPLVDAGCEIRIEDRGCRSRRARGARRLAHTSALICGRGRRQLDRSQLGLREGQQAQDAPGLDRAQAEPGRHERFVRAGESRAGQLAPGGEELFRHKRDPAGSLGHEHQGRGGRALVLDARDQVGKLVSIERR